MPQERESSFEPQVVQKGQKDILHITSVHPISEELIQHYIQVKNADSSILNELLEQNKIAEYIYEGEKFHKRNLNDTHKESLDALNN